MFAYSEEKVHGVLMVKVLFLFSVQWCRLGESGSIARCEWGGEPDVTFIIHVVCIGGHSKKFLFVWNYFALSKTNPVFWDIRRAFPECIERLHLHHRQGWNYWRSIFVKISWANEFPAGCRDVCQRIKICNLEVFKTWQDKSPEKPDLLWRGAPFCASLNLNYSMIQLDLF